MSKHHLTARERIFGLMARNEVDRCSVINPTSIATLENMQRTGSYFPYAHTDPDRMAALAMTGHTILGFDTVAPYFSVHLEAAALGCAIDWGSVDDLPRVIDYTLKDPQAFRMPGNFLERKPVKALLTTIKSIRKKYGPNVVIIGKVIGPWTLAYHLYGVANLLLDIVNEPEKVDYLLDSLKQVPLLFAEAQIEAGADIITWADHVTADLVSPKVYQEFLLPIHKECTTRISYVPTILHVCGSVLDRLDLFSAAGFKVFHLDSRNPIKKAIEIVDRRMLLTGSVNNPSILLNGSPEEVRVEVTGIIKDGLKLISPECAIPPRVPNRNLIEIVKATQAKISI